MISVVDAGAMVNIFCRSASAMGEADRKVVGTRQAKAASTRVLMG